MLREEYERHINNLPYRDVLLELYDFFSVYIYDNGNKINIYKLSNNDVLVFNNDYINKNIDENVSLIFKESIKNGFTPFRSIATSFRINSKNFIDNPTYTNLTKLLSIYPNIEFVTGFLTELENLKENNSDNTKIVFAVGLDDEGGKLKVCDEIDRIFELSRDTNYFVIPIKYCTKSIFDTYIQIFNFSCVHIAGHGDPGHLYFKGEKMTPAAFSKIYGPNRKNELLILNCCFSHSYKMRLAPVSINYITVEGEIGVTSAYTFSDEYYQNLFIINRIYYDSYVNVSVHDLYIYE